MGLSLLLINIATSLMVGAMLGHSGEELIGTLPWALAFSLANGLMEEVWFRGLFLGKLAPISGERTAIAAIAFVFTVMHAAASYLGPAQVVVFLVILFPMALLFGYLMVKTKNVWGAAL